MTKKLTQRDYERMWGEDGPYSQVRLCEETRILDDSISRVFLVVEAEINPFTFEYIQKHRKRFTRDKPVMQLLDHAEYRGKFGYVISAGEVEFRDEESIRFARTQADMTIQILIRMHRFVMVEFGLKSNDDFGIIENNTSSDARFIWNNRTGRVEKEASMWDEQTLIQSPAGIKNNKIRFFIVFAFARGFSFKKSLAKVFALTLKKVASDFDVDVEDCESFHEYVLITLLMPFDKVPAQFVETVRERCNIAMKHPMFQKDYLITNVKQPTPEQVAKFLEQLPLDKDIKF